MQAGPGGAEPVRNRALLGMALAMLAYSLFTLHDAIVKWLVESVSIWQVLLVRSGMIMLGCLAVGRGALLHRALVTPMKRALTLRAALTLGGWLCYFTASRYMPLAQMQTLYFAAPAIVVVLAVPMLGERMTLYRSLAVLIGFGGVVLASDPTSIRASWPPVLVLVAAALWGLGIVLMRRIARRESSLLQMFCGNLVFVLATCVMAGVTWHGPDWRQAGLLGLVGLLGFAGQFCLFESARHAAAAVTATMEYSSIVLAFALGYAIWGDIPAWPVCAGAGLIVAAGVLLLVTERRQAARLQPVQTKARPGLIP